MTVGRRPLAGGNPFAGYRSSAARSASAARRASAAGTARGNRILAAFAVLAGMWLLAVSRVHINASWSDEAWGYVLLPIGAPERGDDVIFDSPEALRAPVPYLKTVRGLPGDRVTVDNDGWVSLNGEPLGRAKARALDGRSLQPIAPVVIPPGRYFVFADHVDSHDSRYAKVGLVPRDRILGRAVALPDIPWLGLDGPLVQPGPAGQESPAGQEARR